jgi:hypothetical protein
MRLFVVITLLLSVEVARAQPVYTLRDGGSGSSNNTLLSTDSAGLLTGSGASGVDGLGLSGSTASALAPNDFIRFHPQITSVTGSGIGNAVMVSVFGGNFELDTSVDRLGLVGHAFAGTWDVVGEAGVAWFSPFFVAPTIRSEPYVDQELMGFHATVHFEPFFVCRGGNCTMGYEDYGHHAVFSNPTYKTEDGGTLHIELMGHSVHLPIADGAVTVGKNIGYMHHPVSDAVSVEDDVAFWIEGSGPTPSGVNASLYSIDPTRSLVHVGPALFGAEFSVHPQRPEPFVAMELSSTDEDPRVILAPRLSTAGEDNITSPLAGMEYYNTDTKRTRQYDGDGWVSPPGIVDSVDVIGRMSDIADTTFANADTPALYRVSYYLQTTATDIGAGSVAFHVAFMDDTTARVLTSGSQPLSTTAIVQQGTFVAKVASGSLEYGVSNSGSYGSAAYDLSVTAERMN